MSATAVTSPAGRAQEWPALMRNHTFLPIWAGNAISTLGDGFHTVALGLWVLQTTGSASAMAVIMTTRVMVGIVLGAVGGTVADRVDRRGLMITMDLARFGLVGLIAYLMHAGSLPFAALVALAGLVAVCSQFFAPAFQSSLINIVGEQELPRASGLLQMSNTLAQVAGPLLAGGVVGFFGGWAALGVDAISFLISGLLIFSAGAFASPRRKGSDHRSFWLDLRDGLAYIRSQPLVRSVVTIAPLVNFFGATMGILFPVIAVKVWMTGSLQFGLVEAAVPLGFAIGAGLVMGLNKRIGRRGWIMMGALTVAGFLVTGTALAPSVGWALPLLLGTGVGLALTNVLFSIVLQTEVPTELAGRVFGTLGSLVNIASPLSMLAAGVLSDHFRPTLIGAGAGTAIALIAVGALMKFPALRNYR